jgi:hypothetical protein
MQKHNGNSTALSPAFPTMNPKIGRCRREKSPPHKGEPAMTTFARCYSIRHEDGALILPDIDCEIDADLEWDNGEPVVSITDVRAYDHDGKGFVSIMHEKDAAFQALACRLAGIAENDESIIEELLSDGEWRHMSRGPGDPDAYWRAA